MELGLPPHSTPPRPLSSLMVSPSLLAKTTAYIGVKHLPPQKK